MQMSLCLKGITCNPLTPFSLNLACCNASDISTFVLQIFNVDFSNVIPKFICLFRYLQASQFCVISRGRMHATLPL